MPLQLPPGVLARPMSEGLDRALGGARVTALSVDLLDSEENLIGEVTSVTGGSLSWDAYAAVKGGGTMDVSDIGQSIDWLNARVRPHVVLSPAEESEFPTTEVSLGVFLCTAPVEKFSVTGGSWAVELLDKLSILDTDIATDDDGNPVAFVAPVGSNIVEVVTGIIASTGESTEGIEPGTKTLSSSLVWEVGTSLLRIINDLLDAGNYASLWCDGDGRFRVHEWVTPAQRVPVYTTLLPFTKGETSLMDPEWTHDRDFYGIPNRYVCIGQGDGETEALVGVATNTDPESPFSFPNRGDRWITRVETEVEATSQTDIDLIAHRRLLASDSVSTSIEVSHAYLPDLLVNTVVRFENPDADLDILVTVLTTEIPLDPTGLVTSTLREVK